MSSSQNSDQRETRNGYVARIAQRLNAASSLTELRLLYMSGLSDLHRVFRPKIGPRETPEERQLREAYRLAYVAIRRERRREYQKNYMRHWRSANPEKAKSQNRRAAHAHRQIVKDQEAADEYFSSLTRTSESS